MTTDTKIKKLSPIQELNNDISLRKKEFMANLPKHIDVDKFTKMVMLSAVKNPKILTADRDSLLLACYNSAVDGLMPDGRESAFVIYKTKKDNNFIETVQYMPMISGIIKKLRNSGELLAIESQCVYSNDFFEVELGLEPKLEHKPNYKEERNIDNIYCVYAIAQLKNGIKQFEIMTKKEIDKIRMISKAEQFAKDKDGKPSKTSIWGVHWEEMAKKTVMRRLSKRLPLSAELLTVITRDDELYNHQEEIKTHEVKNKSAILENLRTVAIENEINNSPIVTDITNNVADKETQDVSPEILAKAEELFNNNGG